MFDRLTLDDLSALSTPASGWCVSLFMPTHRMFPDTEQDPIRFKNLLRQAEERLLEQGMRSPDVNALLAPAHNLLQESEFWQHQSDGLALFISPDTLRYFRLPLPLDELLTISDRFHIKPLLPLFANDGHFYILALSQNEVRLLEGTRHTVETLDLEEQLPDLAEALHYERFNRQLQFHTGTSSPGGMGKRAAMFHGHDVSDEDKNKILRWFHKIDDELPGLLQSRPSPLVLAGVEYLLPLYKEANSYANLVEQGITGNPEALSAAQLHQQAWPLVEPRFTSAIEEAAARYAQFAGGNQATRDVRTAVTAAQNGRVDVLFVALGVQMWGRYHPDTDRLDLHDDAQVGDHDLLDLAAVQTLQNGGTVYALERAQMPEQALLAAVLRY